MGYFDKTVDFIRTMDVEELEKRMREYGVEFVENPVFVDRQIAFVKTSFVQSSIDMEWNIMSDCVDLQFYKFGELEVSNVYDLTCEKCNQYENCLYQKEQVA